MPPVISGQHWQMLEKKRIEERKIQEEKKLERKRLREDNKTKTNLKKKKMTKKKLFDEEEDWVCEVCSGKYSNELNTKTRRRWIECDQCKCAFHYKCLPKKHLNAFGIEEDDDDELAFVCNICANYVDSDCEPFVLSDTESE